MSGKYKCQVDLNTTRQEDKNDGCCEIKPMHWNREIEVTSIFWQHTHEIKSRFQWLRMTIQRQSGWPPEAHGWKYSREILKIFLCEIFSNTPYSLPGNGGRGQPCGIFHSRRRDRCGQGYGGRPSSCLLRFWKVRPDIWTWPFLILMWLDGWMDQNYCVLCIWQERPTGGGHYGDDYWRWPSPSASKTTDKDTFCFF